MESGQAEQPRRSVPFFPNKVIVRESCSGDCRASADHLFQRRRVGFVVRFAGGAACTRRASNEMATIVPWSTERPGRPHRRAQDRTMSEMEIARSNVSNNPESSLCRRGMGSSNLTIDYAGLL